MQMFTLSTSSQKRTNTTKREDQASSLSLRYLETEKDQQLLQNILNSTEDWGCAWKSRPSQWEVVIAE